MKSACSSLLTRAATCATALVLAACADTAPDASPFAAGPARALSGPEVRIGAVDDPVYAFNIVRTLAVAPDGRHVYTLHRNDAFVRIWTVDGEPSGTLGGEGQGPGEFTRPGLLGFFGDSLWVMDTYAYRVSYFGPDGTFLGSLIPLVDIGGPTDAEWSPARPDRPQRDGTFIGRSPSWSDEIARGQLSRTPIVRMTSEGETLGTIWMQRWQPRDILALLDPDGVGGTYFTQPFGDDPIVTTTEGGVVVVDRRVGSGDGAAEIRVTRIGLAGDTAWSTPIPYEPSPLPEARVDSAVSALAEGAFDFFGRSRPDLTRAAFERDLREQTYAPDWTPAVRSIVLAEDGSVWLERFEGALDAEGTASKVWWVLGPAGTPDGTARTPAVLRVHRVTNDAVWGVETDELDVNYIVRYRIERDG